MKALRYILILGSILNSMLLSSCDVHEFPYPEQQEIPFVLHLDYDTALPLYKVVTYHNDQSRADAEDGDVDIRYIIEVYPAEEENKSSERNILKRFVFTKEDITSLDNSVTLMLERGAYNFVVWSDYVNVDQNDLYYDTSTFEEITLRGEEHVGSNDYRDAFNGSISSEVSESVTEATVDMRRPMAKFNLISDDVSEFVALVQSMRVKKSAQNRSGEAQSSSEDEAERELDFSEFDIVFKYHGFMPHVFSVYTNKPVDATSGVSFKSKIRILESGEAELGFDYIFVNGTESMVNVSVEVYDYDGELISRFKPVDVPLVRSKLTTIKANFLTSGDGGVAIIPGFDGDFNVEVD